MRSAAATGVSRWTWRTLTALLRVPCMEWWTLQTPRWDRQRGSYGLGMGMEEHGEERKKGKNEYDGPHRRGWYKD